MKCGILRPVAFALLLFFVFPGVGATTLVPQELAELARSARGIYLGTIIGTSVGWDDQHRFILTHYELQVESVIWGANQGPVLKFSELGGEIDGKGMLVPGVPVYAPGERVIIFTTAAGPRICTLAFGQGKFVLRPNREKGGEAQVEQAAGKVGTIGLAAFLEQVRQATGGR